MTASQLPTMCRPCEIPTAEPIRPPPQHQQKPTNRRPPNHLNYKQTN